MDPLSASTPSPVPSVLSPGDLRYLHSVTSLISVAGRRSDCPATRRRNPARAHGRDAEMRQFPGERVQGPQLGQQLLAPLSTSPTRTWSNPTPVITSPALTPGSARRSPP